MGWVKRFIDFHNKRRPGEIGEAEITDFLSHLAEARNVSVSTQNQDLNALISSCGRVGDRVDWRQIWLGPWKAA